MTNLTRLALKTSLAMIGESGSRKEAIVREALDEIVERCSAIAREVAESYHNADGFPSPHAVGAEAANVAIRREFGCKDVI